MSIVATWGNNHHCVECEQCRGQERLALDADQIIALLRALAQVDDERAAWVHDEFLLEGLAIMSGRFRRFYYQAPFPSYQVSIHHLCTDCCTQLGVLNSERVWDPKWAA